MAHCPCRVSYRLVGRGCDHPTEVCMKFDELADFVIEQGLGRELTEEEALDVIRLSRKMRGSFISWTMRWEKSSTTATAAVARAGTWATFAEGRIPRDDLMATYFMRDTEYGECTGCGECVTICPVEAVEMSDGVPVVDGEWCIGCGVCATVCPSDAVVLNVREDRVGESPAATFRELHEKILKEKKSGTGE